MIFHPFLSFGLYALNPSSYELPLYFRLFPFVQFPFNAFYFSSMIFIKGTIRLLFFFKNVQKSPASTNVGPKKFPKITKINRLKVEIFYAKTLNALPLS